MKAIDVNKLDRESKCVLFVAGQLTELHSEGFIRSSNPSVPGPMTCTTLGMANYDQLLAVGFLPTVDEIAAVLRECDICELREVDCMANGIHDHRIRQLEARS